MSKVSLEEMVSYCNKTGSSSVAAIFIMACPTHGLMGRPDRDFFHYL